MRDISAWLSFALVTVCLGALAVLGWGVLWNLLHIHSDGTGHSHELGQLMGLAGWGTPTPLGIYRPQIGELPDPIIPLVARLLHLDIWVCCLSLILPLVALASLVFDWILAHRDPFPQAAYCHSDYWPRIQ